VVTYTYSATGQQIGQYQVQGTLLTSQLAYYDADDRLVTMTDGMGKATTLAYDGVGNRIRVTDPNGNTVTAVYDARNRLVETIEPLGVTVSYTYDNSGNQQTATDALGHTATTLYDALDRATTLISAVGGVTTIVYDVAGRPSSLTDPAGNSTTWSYDAADRVTTVTEPNGSTVTSVYDADNELTDTTDQDGRRTTFAYDNDGRQTGETWVGASPSERITYTYDSAGQLTGATDANATLTIVYDNDGRVGTLVTSGPGTGQPTVTLTYGYDQIGDETSVTDSLSSQGITSLAYDADQRVTSITQYFGGTAGPQVTFGYDNGSRLTSISRQIGSSTTATEVNTTIVYDAANRVGTMTQSKWVYNFFPPGWSVTPLATQVYSYDNASRLTSETDAEGTASFTYDNSNELTGVSGSRSESYSYDLNGNRTGTGYHTTVMNELSTAPGHTYTYDNAGNLISDNNGSATTTYTYDYRNRLINLTTGATVVATYTYNALNQRIGVKDNGTQAWTVYYGSSPDAHPYADFNGSGSLTMRYLFGPGALNGAVTSVILARTSSGGTTAWYLTDKLGSVRDIVDTSGNVLDHIVYDSFGNIVTETNASNGDRFKFAGMQYDSTTGQNYDHARWYGSAPGRFVSLDPKSFAAGDANIYRYVSNNPTNQVDTSGEFAAIGVGAGLGLIFGLGTEIAQQGADWRNFNWNAIWVSTLVGGAMGGTCFWLRLGNLTLAYPEIMAGMELAEAAEVAFLWDALMAGVGDIAFTGSYSPFQAFVGGWLTGFLTAPPPRPAQPNLQSISAGMAQQNEIMMANITATPTAVSTGLVAGPDEYWFDPLFTYMTDTIHAVDNMLS
jgi:RHS repeat-associated protein